LKHWDDLSNCSKAAGLAVVDSLILILILCLAATLEALCTLLQWAENVYVLSNDLPIVGSKPVRPLLLRAIRQLIALANCVRSLVVNAINVVAGVGVNYRLQFNSARN
jgi:hypothetical protein